MASESGLQKTSSSPIKIERSPMETLPKRQTLWDHLPPWISTNLRSWRSWKVLIRCCFAGWVSFVLLLPNASLNVLGTAGFFAVLASVFLPPNFPVQLFIFLISTLVLGLLLGWGLGAAAMRAANAVRDPSLILSTYASLQNSTAYQSNPTLATTDAIFSGDFLDVPATVIYGVFLGVSTFLFSVFRAYAPKLIFFSLFGMIGVDVFCTIGPLFPTGRFTILNSFLISVGCYAGVAVVSTVFVFPESMNHAYLNGILGQLGKVKAFLEIQDEVLKEVPSDGLREKVKGMRAGVLGGMQQLMATSAFLPLEFSWGKWNSDDVKELEDPLVAVVARISGLHAFVNIASRSDFRPPNASGEATPTASSASSTIAARTVDTNLLRQLNTYNYEKEIRFGVQLSDVLPLLDHSTKALRESCVKAVAAIHAYLFHINNHRWTPRPGVNANLRGDMDKAYEDLKSVLDGFKTEGRLEILEPYLSSDPTASPPLRSLYISYVFSSNLISTSEGILGLLDFVRITSAKRTRNRLWAPKGLRALGNALFRTRGDEGDGAFGEDTKPATPKSGKEKRSDGEETYRRDPDSRPPTNVFQKIMNIVHIVYKWTKSPEAIFSFKTVFVTIALWLPAIIKRSANFYYVQRGMWALIMAQTTMNIYAADQIYNLVVRLIGTVVGLVLGLITWYIGAGAGNGSPYGEAAVVGVVMFPMMFIRLYSPPQFLPGVILGGATWVLIVGYSWIDGHIPQYSTPGIGWSVAWKRFVLVVIGSAASFFMMMFPPTSGRKAVRRRNAALIESLGGIYSFLISIWIDPTTPAAMTPDEKTAKERQWRDEFRTRLVAVSQELQAIQQLTEIARWEGSIRGKWPYKEYVNLIEVEGEMVSSLAQLGGALSNLDDDWRVSFTHATKVLNPHFIADVMAMFTLVSQSLSTAEPMHQVLPGALLERLFYHHHKHQHHHQDEPEHDHDATRLKSLEYMYYATGVVAVFQLLNCLDQLHLLTRELCGEVPFRGFNDWRDEYDRAHFRGQ